MDQNGLKAIAYVSASVEPMTTETLEDLLIEARELNRKNEITGALLYSDGTFMQYFEGPAAAMQDTYRRICRSRKHTRIHELLNEPIQEREFPQWHMALAQPRHSELLTISTAGWVSRTHNGAAVFNENCLGMTLLREFWSRRR